MIFIGTGAPLYRAIFFCIKKKIKINYVCLVNKRENIIYRDYYRQNKIKVTYNYSLFKKKIDSFKKQIIFSINNSIILDDDILATNNVFFNIHNALVQKCRGNAVVCIFKALCFKEKFYGLTLHHILPKTKIDAGPVVDQIKFRILKSDTFFSILSKSLIYHQRIFEKNLFSIIKNKFKRLRVSYSKKSFHYDNLQSIIEESNSRQINLAKDLGLFRYKLIRFSYLINKYYKLKKNE